MKTTIMSIAAIAMMAFAMASCRSHSEITYNSGVQTETVLGTWHNCNVCGGKGSCQKCNGTGKIKGGTCATCQGTGKCQSCNGDGGYRSQY